MNILDAVVTKVLDTPKYFRVEVVEWWQVQVEYNCYGVISTTNLSFKNREQADAVSVGYKFQC